MVGDARGDKNTVPAPAGGFEEHIARRTAELRAHDEQIGAAMPKPDVDEAR
jgi:hypothetical protein